MMMVIFYLWVLVLSLDLFCRLKSRSKQTEQSKYAYMSANSHCLHAARLWVGQAVLFLFFTALAWFSMLHKIHILYFTYTNRNRGQASFTCSYSLLLPVSWYSQSVNLYMPWGHVSKQTVKSLSCHIKSI